MISMVRKREGDDPVGFAVYHWDRISHWQAPTAHPRFGSWPQPTAQRRQGPTVALRQAVSMSTRTQLRNLAKAARSRRGGPFVLLRLHAQVTQQSVVVVRQSRWSQTPVWSACRARSTLHGVLRVAQLEPCAETTYAQGLSGLQVSHPRDLDALPRSIQGVQ